MQEELKRLEARRAELQGELTEAEASLKATRAALIEGTAERHEASAASAAVATYREALAELDGRIAARRAEAEARRLREAREAHLEKMVAQAEKAKAAREAHDAALVAAAESLQAHMNALLEAREAWSEATRAFVQLAREEAPSLTGESPPYGTSRDAHEAPAARLIQELRRRGAAVDDVLSDRIKAIARLGFHVSYKLVEGYVPPELGTYGEDVEAAFEKAMREARRAAA